jgi:hypothetical protein
MKEYSVKRNGKDDLVFSGELLVILDDRELMGVTPNWWELSLFKTCVGKYILASTFHINYPHRRKMHGAICFSSAENVRDYLTHDCNGPTMIADTLINRAARRDVAFQFKPVQHAPKLPTFRLTPQIDQVGIAGTA